jgi:hypothetical protein
MENDTHRWPTALYTQPYGVSRDTPLPLPPCATLWSVGTHRSCTATMRPFLTRIDVTQRMGDPSGPFLRRTQGVCDHQAPYKTSLGQPRASLDSQSVIDDPISIQLAQRISGILQEPHPLCYKKHSTSVDQSLKSDDHAMLSSLVISIASFANETKIIITVLRGQYFRG